MILVELKGTKHMETLKVTFQKQLDEDTTIYKTAYFNENYINQTLQILSNITGWKV